ncbi:MAG: PHP domain-containing protein [Nitrospiraceae bacterium]|nr:PHP domain-containing protein [Nitrospiraceae bacterium]
MTERSAFRVDLHVHTSSSGDNDADLGEVIECAVERGLDGIAITEHYSYRASEPVEQLRNKYRGVITIFRGVEFSAAEGHCLVFGVDTDRLAIKYAPIRDVVRAVTAAGGVVIPTHPYRGVNSLGDDVLTVPGISGLEGCNGGNMHAMNARAIEAAIRLGLPYTGGSDAHAASEVGSCYTEFERPFGLHELVAQIRSGRFRGVDTRKISRHSFF